MPWKNDNGGGWQGGGGGNRGPWGQGPSGPPGGGGRKPSPQDLDDLLKRLQDTLKSILPSGGRGSWLVPVVLLAAFWIYSSIYQVQADERGVVLRLGAYTRTADPGLHFALWPVETMEKIPFARQRQIEIGGTDNGLMLAGDQNIVNVKFTVFWRIKDPEQFLFNTKDQESLIKAVSESAMREIIGRTPAEEFRTTGRKAAEDQVFDITQRVLDGYQAGILLTGIRLNDADPPPEVREAFAEVQRAEQDQAKFINEADQYANQKIRNAEGEAAKIVEDAKGYKARVVAEAQGESQRFVKVYDEYAKARDVTRERLFLETMEYVLGQSNKVILEGKDGGGVVPYLPLPEIQKRRDEPVPSSAGQGTLGTGGQ